MRYRRASGLVRGVLAAAGGLLVLGGVLVVGMLWLRPGVAVTEAVEGPVVQAFYSTGTVSPVREYPIRSSIAGTLTELHVERGDRVERGALLARVSDPDLAYRADQAEAELEERLALADEADSPILREFDRRIEALEELLEIAERERERVRGLLERNAASQSDLDRALDRWHRVWSDLESARSQREARRLGLYREVRVGRAAVASARWNLERQALRSPIDGVVLDRPLAPGTWVGVNEALMRIADVSPERLVMRAAVDEEDKTRVEVDQVVRMTLYSFPGEVMEGRVERIYDQADADRRTFEVDVRPSEAPAGLSAGMTGELAFVVAERERAVVLPSQAVRDGRVWVVRDGRVEGVDVETGLRSVERVEVLSGVEVGDRVVISAGGLRDGQMVREKWVDPVVAAGLNRPREDPGARFRGFR